MTAPLPEADLPSSFARDLRTVQLSEDRFVGEIDTRWNVMRGPNGGFLAAVLLDTLIRRCADPTRKPRLLSAHYPRVPRPGPIEVHTRVLRQGRSVSWLSAELIQEGEACVLARAAFSNDWPSLEYQSRTAPMVPPSDAGQVLRDGLPPFTQNFEYRSLFATPQQRGAERAVGGYIRLRDPHPCDAPLLTAVSDAWFPSTFAHDARPVMAATLDLTIHFRNYAVLQQLDPHAYLLSIFRSNLATEGFFDEDGEIFAPTGELIAHSRQLAIATPTQRA